MSLCVFAKLILPYPGKDSLFPHGFPQQAVEQFCKFVLQLAVVFFNKKLKKYGNEVELVVQ